MSHSDYCICCKQRSDLVSVHEELSLQGYKCSHNSPAVLVDHCFSIKIVACEVSYAMCSTCVSKVVQSCMIRDRIVHNLNSTEYNKGQTGVEEGYNVEAVITESSQLYHTKIKKEYNGLTSTEFEDQYEYGENSDKEDGNTFGTHNNMSLKERPQKKVADDNVGRVTKNTLTSSINHTKKNELIDDTKTTIYCRIKIHPEKTIEATEIPVDISKRSNANKLSINERRKGLTKNYVTNDNVKKKSENSRLKDEFKSLIINCKDIAIFSWNKSKFKCLVCNELFSDKTSYKMHASNHTTKDFDKVCPKGNFYDVPDLKVDISRMKCRHCGDCVTELDAFRLHLSISHNIQAGDLLRRILPFNLTEDELKCGVCDKAFINMWTLNMHMNEHSTNYICPHCGKFFITFNRMRNHINHSHVTGTFKCTQCDETFESLSKRGYHIAAAHRTVKHICQYCSETFKAFEHKIRHLAEVHNKELKRYKCESCPAAYITTKNLKTHIRNIHLQERNHTCGECGVSFFSRRELQDHMVKHTGKREFACQICHKTFGRKRNLVQHMKIHNK